MSKADEYRELAAECVQLTRSVQPDARAALIDMAQRWLQLADEAERVKSAPTTLVDTAAPRAWAMQAQPMQQQQSKAKSEDEK